MATKAQEVVTIKPVEWEYLTVRVIGDTPMIMHAWSTKAKREMLEAQQGKKKVKKDKVPKNPVFDFIESMYWLEGKPDVDERMSEEECEKLFIEAVQNGARFGFPDVSFKQAGNSAAYRMGWVKNQTALRGSYFIEGKDNGFIEIHSDIPEMREDMVKIQMTTDIRYRGQFNNWYADLPVKYNKNGQFTKEDILNIINAGGAVCGVGEWRPERDGNFGMYHIEVH